MSDYTPVGDLSISIIMPSLNEEENLPLAVQNTLDALDHFKVDGEIIVVNDGSTDGTREIAEQFVAKESRVRVIHHDTPRGIGGSFWEGVDAAEKNLVTMFPGDNENDPWESLQYVHILQHVDMVIPFVYNRTVRGFFRNILSIVYRSIINITFSVNFNYTNGTVLYRRTVLNNLDHRSAGFFFQTDILIRAVKRGYLFAEVPYRLGLRSSGRSKAISYPSLVMVIKGYLKLVRDLYYSKNKIPRDSYVEDSSTFRRASKENVMYKTLEK